MGSHGFEHLPVQERLKGLRGGLAKMLEIDHDIHLSLLRSILDTSQKFPRIEMIKGSFQLNEKSRKGIMSTTTYFEKQILSCRRHGLFERDQGIGNQLVGFNGRKLGLQVFQNRCDRR